MPTRDDILDAAAAIHRRDGLATLSLRRVAADVGVTPMALYRHFADKAALLDALALRGFAELEQWFARAALAPTPLERVRAGLAQYRDFALAHPRAFELMYLAPRGPIPEAPQSLRASPSPSFAALAASLAECMATGVLRAGDPAETILLLWATAHGLIALHFTGRFAHDDARFRVLFDRALGEQLRLLAP